MTTAPTPDSVMEALIRELATAVSAIVDDIVGTPAPSGASGDGWCLTGSVSGARRGSIEAWIDLGGAETLARRITGVESPDRPAIVGLLRDLWNRAATALCAQPAHAGLALGFGTARAAGAPPDGTVYELQAPGFIARVAVAGRLSAAGAGPQENLDVVLDIDLPLVVRFARTMLPLRTLAALGPGSVVDMERSPDEPVQLLVGDRVIAHGEVVVVGGNYGVRITDVTSPAKRVRLEA